MAALAIRDDTTSQGYALSVVLHVAIVLLAWTGLPFLHARIPTETPPLIVDLVPIADVTAAAPKPTPDAPQEPTPAQPVQPAPVQAPAPPADAMPPPPTEKVPEKVVDKTPPPTVKPVPKPPTPKSKQDDIAMLQDLLKDMQKKAPKAQPTQSKAAEPSNNIAPNISDRATMTELDAIRRHIESCWRIDPGKEGVENLSADIKVLINPDGSVSPGGAQILDMGRYFADPTFRTFANSARNAVLGCGNIPISPEHYNQLKEITMTFTPQGRIN